MIERPKAPLARLSRDGGKPEWQEVLDLLARHGQPMPPIRLRDELVTMLLWARYGQAVADQDPKQGLAPK